MSRLSSSTKLAPARRLSRQELHVQVAAIFKVSVATMRRWVKTGHVPSMRRGRLVRVDMTRIRGVDADDIARMAREARELRP